LQSRSWEQDGQKRSKVEVVANDVTFLGGPGAGPATGDGGTATASEPAAKKTDKKAGAKGGAKKSKKDEQDVVIEDIGDEPINLDDIPF
jgi:single-stranded DNA-binding protein